MSIQNGNVGRLINKLNGHRRKEAVKKAVAGIWGLVWIAAFLGIFLSGNLALQIACGVVVAISGTLTCAALAIVIREAKKEAGDYEERIDNLQRLHGQQLENIRLKHEERDLQLGRFLALASTLTYMTKHLKGNANVGRARLLVDHVAEVLFPDEETMNGTYRAATDTIQANGGNSNKALEQRFVFSPTTVISADFAVDESTGPAEEGFDQ